MAPESIGETDVVYRLVQACELAQVCEPAQACEPVQVCCDGAAAVLPRLAAVLPQPAAVAVLPRLAAEALGGSD